MGCGSSSMKGDVKSGTDANDPAPQPLRQVKTDFSQVDYDQEARKRRMTEYAPNEEIRPKSKASTAPDGTELKSIPEAANRNGSNVDGINVPTGGGGGVAIAGIDPAATASNSTGLQPRSIDEVNKTNPLRFTHEIHNDSSSVQYRTEGKDSTTNTSNSNSLQQRSNSNNNDLSSVSAKDYSLRATSSNSGGDSTVGDDGYKAERKSSWLGQKYSQFQAIKRGTPASDEELMQQFGMNRQELVEWAEARKAQSLSNSKSKGYWVWGIDNGGATDGSGGGGGDGG